MATNFRDAIPDSTAGQTSAQMALRDPDIRLMLRVRDAADQGAFAELVELYQHRLVSILNHLVGNRDEAEDLAQEVFLRVFKSRDRYHPTAKFSTWLFTIANNLALNQRRNRHRRATVQLELSESGSVPSGGAERAADTRGRAPGDGLQQTELADVVRQAMDSLNERQRLAVVLNKFEDMGYAEIAEVLGMTSKAVKSLLSRARARLRELLVSYIYMDGAPAEPEEDEP